MSLERKIYKNIGDTVLSEGYCVGCGVCTIIEGSPYKITRSKYRQFQVENSEIALGQIKEGVEERISRVCPFSDGSVNEDVLSNMFLDTECLKSDKKLGYYLETYAGYALIENYRELGSSGGIGSWLLSELLNSKEIDKVVHVKESLENGRLFEYTISSSDEEIVQGGKSKYYPVELSYVLERIKNEEGYYAIVGIPCFIKAVRLLMKEEPIFKERIKYCVGLVCGHLKSENFANMLAWQIGIPPNLLNWIDFRTKLKDSNANAYGVSVSSEKRPLDYQVKTAPMRSLYGGNWGHGFFKYKSCDFCDDVLAETADVTIGDAWLPEYIKDSGGTNIIIVRNKNINYILQRASEKKQIKLINLSVDDVIKSQDAGLRHRREGLAYRLKREKETGRWVPTKRITPAITINKRNQEVQDLRKEIAKSSHVFFEEAIEKQDFNYFILKMEPLLNKYQRLYKLSLLVRIISKIKRTLNKG